MRTCGATRRTSPFAFPDVRGRATVVREGFLRTPLALSVVMPCFRDAEPNQVHLAVTGVLSQDFAKAHHPSPEGRSVVRTASLHTLPASPSI